MTPVWATLIIGAAAVTALLVSQHLLFAGMVALFRKRVQPIYWLFRRSELAIRAILHLAAVVVAGIGITFGFLASSNLVLAVCIGLATTLSFGAEWTFMGNWGPLAKLVRSRAQESARDSEHS